jgi:hypothetical protein
MYCSSRNAYGIRLGCPEPGDFQLVATSRPGVARQREAIICTELDELAWLRKAQAWGTPLFQPGHVRYVEALTRLRDLEARERAASEGDFP